jgi:hypothetical protein
MLYPNVSHLNLVACTWSLFLVSIVENDWSGFNRVLFRTSCETKDNRISLLWDLSSRSTEKE